MLLPPQSADEQGEPIDCPRCSAAVLPTDGECAYCGLARAMPTPEVRAPRAKDKPAKRRGPRPAATASASAPPHIDADAVNASEVEEYADGTVTLWDAGAWHGGTLMPPPYLMAGGRVESSDTGARGSRDSVTVVADGHVSPEPPEAGNTCNRPGAKRPASKYHDWVKANGQAIRQAMTGPGVKAFGAAAGRLWRGLPPAERGTKERKPQTANGSLEQGTEEPEPAAPLDHTEPGAQALSPAQLATVARNKAGALLRKAETAARTLATPTPAAEAAPLACQKSSAQERLEALKARVRARIAHPGGSS